MLDPVLEFWFGVFQSIGGVATAIALFFVGFQIYYARNQTNLLVCQLLASVYYYALPIVA
jgi:hypothetical protein